MFKRTLCCASVFLILVFSINISYADPRYFLCGSDEDGCFEESAEYCACITVDEVHINQPFCLNFDTMTCEPLVNVPQCERDMIYEDQSKCLATIFQSESEPPCPVTTPTFCAEHHTPICAANGDVKTCH